MAFDVRALSAQKCQNSAYAEVDWLRAFETARQSLKFIDIDFYALEQLALASESPAKFTVLTRLIYQYGKSYPQGDRIFEVILQCVNTSPFALSDWIDAVDFFHGWLEKNRRKIDFLPMLKYLECCVASADAREGGYTFRGLIEDMLAVSGYDG